MRRGVLVALAGACAMVLGTVIVFHPVLAQGGKAATATTGLQPVSARYSSARFGLRERKGAARSSRHRAGGSRGVCEGAWW